MGAIGNYLTGAYAGFLCTRRLIPSSFIAGLYAWAPQGRFLQKPRPGKDKGCALGLGLCDLKITGPSGP